MNDELCREKCSWYAVVFPTQNYDVINMLPNLTKF